MRGVAGAFFRHVVDGGQAPDVVGEFSFWMRCIAAVSFRLRPATGLEVGFAHGVDAEGVFSSGFGIEEDRVVFSSPHGFTSGSDVVIMPDDFVAEVGTSEDGIHEQLQVMGCGIVAVQVDRSRRLEDAVHLEETYSHKDEIRLHRLAMRHARRFDDGIGGRMLIGEFTVLVDVDVLEGPGVLEGGAGGLAADGRFVGAIRVERRVEIDQVHAVAVHAAHDEKIIFRPDGTTGKVTPISA